MTFEALAKKADQRESYDRDLQRERRARSLSFPRGRFFVVTGVFYFALASSRSSVPRSGRAACGGPRGPYGVLQRFAYTSVAFLAAAVHGYRWLAMSPRSSLHSGAARRVRRSSVACTLDSLDSWCFLCSSSCIGDGRADWFGWHMRAMIVGR